MDMTKLSGQVEKHKKEKETLFIATFYIENASDLPSYELDYGDNITADLSSYIPVGSNISILVKEVKVVEVIPNWRVPAVIIVTGSSNLRRGGSMSVGGGDLGDSYYGRLTRTVITMDPKWFGARVADKDDVSDSIQSFMTGGVCKKGEYVFNNAGKGDSGTADTALSPINFSALETVSGITTVKKIISQKITTRGYRIRFHTKKGLAAIEPVIGVNPSTSAFPKKYSPSGSSSMTEGLWLSKGDEIEILNDKNGDSWSRVERFFLKAPQISGTQYHWDPEKNGGTWTWSD